MQHMQPTNHLGNVKKLCAKKTRKDMTTVSPVTPWSCFNYGTVVRNLMCYARIKGGEPGNKAREKQHLAQKKMLNNR